ncbi:MAG TPA: hypothetical protein VMV90_01100 [Rectinemataceae bacterium]|nr:hypothetical protein [Rectinemataceae bacterium]
MKRNASAAAIYKEGAKSILSRSISSLALSLADQHKELGKVLLELASVEGTQTALAELEPEFLEQPATPASFEACAFLESARRIETEDYELLAALAGAFIPFSTEGAERLAALSEQARKRAAWAQDHLELLNLCP